MSDAMEHAQRAPAGQKPWTCDHCSSTFGRLDHFKRHILTHNPERGYSCQFCRALFGRGDVLRRHWKSCKTRLEAGQAIPDGLRGGKHKRACDGCAVIRKACDGETPCSECNHRGKPCTYQRLFEADDDPNGQRVTGKVPRTQEDQGHEVDTDVPDDGWDLGYQTFYPSREARKAVYARNHYGI